MVCASGGRVLYQGKEKKGHEGVKGSPAEFYDGTLIHDHEATWQNYGKRHQECLAHVERYLRSSIENEPWLKWNKQMLEWIKEAVHWRNSMPEGGGADPQEIERLVERYGKILEKAKEEYEYEPPGDYFKDGYNLYKRMWEDRDDYLLFLYDPSIPPTNNAAENAARKYKRKNAQVMCFRSGEGRDYFCDGLSVMESMRADGENMYEGVRERFNQGTGAV
ncbi:transposase [Blautia schinkii]|nr:transposase [Blautia schinkii]